ncbi:MAG: lipoprotein-releasing system ATP-binding protein LolD [Candidatus Altiarchaeales archaeon]|nr:MAG: lipoprotein-releasing system ATP-binding protein LolD [Candidatus Altiarchaeales archaeon]
MYGKINGDEPIIRLENVWKVYHIGKIQVEALRGLNLSVFPREFVAIMGPSGSGKSTLMNMIGCLDVPTKGKVYLEGRDISKLHESDLAQIRGKIIGFVFQSFNLMPSLTAVENVMLPMTFQGVDKILREKRAIELLNGVDLGDRIYHKPSELSGGEQQRVAIARALANDPDVILADEPTGNLDSRAGREVMEMLSKLQRERNKTIEMVTHDESLSKYAHRVIHIKDGRTI